MSRAKTPAVCGFCHSTEPELKPTGTKRGHVCKRCYESSDTMDYCMSRYHQKCQKYRVLNDQWHCKVCELELAAETDASRSDELTNYDSGLD